jgi:hypothetical protein
MAYVRTVGPTLNLGSLRAGVLTGVTSGTGAPVLIQGNVSFLTIYVLGVGTISTGTLIIEEALLDPTGQVATGGFGGTWSAIGAPVDLTLLTGGGANGLMGGIHITGTFSAIRTRIGTSVTGTGGAVATWITGSGA